MRHFINKPIENYEGLRIICGENNAMGLYATSLFSYFRDRFENKEFNSNIIELFQEEHASDKDGVANSTPPIASSPATSLRQRSQCTSKGGKSPSMMNDLLIVVCEMGFTIMNLTHWMETLFTKVIEVKGYEQ